MPKRMEEKLRDYFSTKLPDKKGLVVEQLIRMTEGFSYETFLCTAKWEEGQTIISQDFVIRMEPEYGPVPPYDVEKQYRLLKILENTLVPVPRVYWLEKDEKILGKPFFLMEKVEGEIPIPWKTDKRTSFADPAQKERMAEEFVKVLAQIHTVDWESLGLAFLEAPKGPEDYALQEIKRWEEIIERDQLAPQPILAEALCWLKKNIPTAERTTLVHGDYRLGNFIWRDNRIAAFLDWEMTALGDPMSDLGWVCMKRIRGKSPLMSALVDKEVLFQKYEEMAGIKVREESLFFWEVLGYVKLAAVELAGIRACVSGKNPDIRLVTFEVLLLYILDELAGLLGF